MGKKLNNYLKSSGAAAHSTVFETVSLSSDSVFQRAISILHTSYLDSASEHGFQYSQVTLVKNHIFLNEYKTFYQEKKASNYNQEELQEAYGFLLFETENQGKVKLVPENYTTNYTRPSFGYDCHVATNTSKVSSRTSHFRAFELSQYYLYELSGSTVAERPRQLCPYVIVAFQYREPRNMAAHTSIPELLENVPSSPWKRKLIIQGCFLCDITLWSTYGAMIPTQLPLELDFKYVVKVSSLKKRLPEAAFQKQNYLEQKVCHQDMCFNLYEVELSNKQGEKIDKLTEYIKNEELAIIKCLEDGGFFIVLTSSALISDIDFEDKQNGLHGLHLFHSSTSAGTKDLKVEDGISMKLIPILPALNCALLEAKKSFTEGSCPSTLVKQNFQALYKVDRSPSLPASSQDGIKETALFGQLTNGFDLVPPVEKCSLQSFTQLKSYLSDPSAYVLEVCTALDLLAEHPETPCFSDGICDAGFSLVMTPDPEFLDSEAEVRKETETKKKSEDICKTRKRSMVSLSPATNLRVQPKRKASRPLTLQSERVNLYRPFSKRTATGTNNDSESATTLKLAKGQFPQKRKRGAEVLTAQFVQTTKLNRKNQEAPISKDVPVATKAKRARRREKSPVKTVPKTKPSVKKSPQKQRVNIVKGKQNPRIRKHPQHAKEQTISQLQSELLLDGQEDININEAQLENTTVTQKDLPENSVINYDSQALNMLADLALSSATSSTPSSESMNLPCSSELPKNDVSLSKENSLRGTSDHEYHRGIKCQKSGSLPKPSTDKYNSVSELTVSQDEESLVPCSQAPVKAQSRLPEETLETSDSNQNSCVVIEHSYALLLAEHSKKQLQQRGIQGPTFAKNGSKGPEAGTPVGKVMPFRHQQNTSPLQKVSDPFVKHKNRLMSSNLKDFHCSHTVFNCDGSFKVTFKCESEYVFSLDSKYTNNPLEKTVIRALHGPWNTDLPDNVEEVKLLLHMWVALFYSNQSKVIRSSRKVVEHSNPAKFVSINSTIDSFEFSEIDDSFNVERCSTDPLLETTESSKGQVTETSFPDSNALLPFIKPPPVRGLELCVQNEQKELFVREDHQDKSGIHNFMYPCHNEVTGQETPDKIEPSNQSSNIESTQTNRPSIPDEDKTFQPPDSTRMTSHNDTATQITFTKTFDGTNNPSITCQNSLYSTLESKVDIFHAAMQSKTEAVQGLIHHNSPTNKDYQPSLERKDDNMGYVMINLEPVTLTFENNSYVPIQTEVVNRADKPTTFNMELIKQVSPGTTLTHPVSTFEKAQTQCLKDIPSLAVSEQKGNKYLCASSVSRETLAKEMCSVQNESPFPVSSSSSDNSVVMEAVSLVKSSSYSLPNEEMRISEDLFLQTPRLTNIPSEEIEPMQFAVSSSASTISGRNDPFHCISLRNSVSDDSLEIRNDDKSCLNSENKNFESFNSAFTKQTNLTMNKEEISLQLSEEDSDIHLTLTISPPSSPREQILANEIEQLQEAPLSSVEEVQDRAEEIIDPGEVTLRENREVNSADYTSVSEEPLEDKERKDDDFQPVTIVLSKDNSSLEISEDIVTSDFPFNSLIEEVSPPSSPDPLMPSKETRPSQEVSPCSLKLHDIQYEKSSKSPQIESVDVAIIEKENCFVGSTHAVGQDNLTRMQQMQHYAEMPLMLNGHPKGNDRHLTLPDKVTEEIVQSEHEEVSSFPEKVQCCDSELNQPASGAKCEDDIMPSLEKRVKSGSPLQSVSTENGNLDLEHLVLETNDPLFSSKKITENKSLAAMFLSTAASSGMVSVSLEQTTSPESTQKNLFSSDLKTDEGSYFQVKSLNCDPVDGAGITQEYTHLEVPKLDSASDSATLTHCTRLINIDTDFQTQEIPVVKIANLLMNGETKAELHKETTDLGGIGLQSTTTCSPKGEQAVDMLQKTADISENINKELSVSFVPKSFDSLVCGVSKEHMENKNISERLGTKNGSETLHRDMDVSVNSDIHYEPLSGESDQDAFSDCRNPKLDMEDSCTFRASHTGKREDATKNDYDTFMSINNSGNEDRGYSYKTPRLETSLPSRNWPSGFKKEDKCVPYYIQIRDLHGFPRTYANFTVTKELKDTTRTLHSLRRHPYVTAKCGLISSWTSTWQIADDLTQNTLDLEYLRFAHKVKKLVKNGKSQHSTSATSAFPAQIAVRAFPLTKISESPVLHCASRSKSPLMVTVVHSDPKQSQHMRNYTSGNLDNASSFWKEGCSHSRPHFLNAEGNQTASFHLNKLKYNSTLKESRNDVSLILNEYSEFNKVMLSSNENKDLNMASGVVTSHDMYSFFPRMSASYEDVVTDFCTSLHVKLKSVMKEACKNTFLFCLIETEDKSFFLTTKNILRKGGHIETDPQHFFQGFHRENDTLLVIIRNEDISLHLHRIPSLLKLKRFPNVVFAGVDGPEDITNHTYQEVFHTGGFVVSDDKILETVTIVQLQEIARILVKLNGNGKWRWLLHYRESKKLKENARVDSVAHKKNVIVKSCQSANIIELLPYHECDSRPPTKAEILKCLLNLQIQCIDARHAVFLTDKLTVSRQFFENNGILITDVNNFIENIQTLAAPFNHSYW
ncbi:PREDICTED: protein FAM208B [Chrysochloris asiatica]|uniref:Protein FAM208B n=1 Tax=Chrysochloris asiatica TaxID=185453 RepID=A0A9B0TEY4_CHRAS|nr:PREDICTED: protein FAM208B [Chrysochloris asiatica]